MDSGGKGRAAQDESRQDPSCIKTKVIFMAADLTAAVTSPRARRRRCPRLCLGQMPQSPEHLYG